MESESADPRSVVWLVMYLDLSSKNGSADQRPEGLYWGPQPMTAVIVCSVAIAALMLVDPHIKRWPKDRRFTRLDQLPSQLSTFQRCTVGSARLRRPFSTGSDDASSAQERVDAERRQNHQARQYGHRIAP